MKKLLTCLLAAIAAHTATAAADVQPLPFHDDFEHHDNVGLIDSNNDNIGFGLNYDPKTGKFDSFVYDGREAWKAADDWMVFPWFHFEEGLKYKITVSFKTSDTGTADFECMLVKGDEDDDDIVITSSAVKLGETWVIRTDATDTWQEFTYEVTPALTGDYRFALHFISEAKQKYHMDWITIGEGLADNSPVKSTAGYPSYKVVDNKLNVQFKITPPSLDCSGNALPSDLSALVVRTAPGRKSVEFTLDGLAPNTAATFTDPDGVGTGAEYAVHIMNGTARGMKTVVAAKPTFGYPKAPANVTIARLEGNRFSATWDAVTASTSSSALFNPATVTYSAKYPDSSPVELTFTGATSAEFDYPEPTESQEGAYINLYACNERGESTAAKSNAIVMGPALEGEFAESFASAKFQNQTWSLVPATGAWGLNGSGVTAQDGDKGMLRYGQAAGATGEAISPILDLSAMKRPVLSLWVYIKPTSTYDNTVTPVIRRHGAADEYPVGAAFTDHTMTDGSELPSANGWHRYLWEIKDVPAEVLAKCNLVFKGAGASSWNYVYLDNLTIKDYPADSDLAIEAVTLPKKSEVGRKSEIKVDIANRGLNPIESYTVKMLDGDAVIATAEGSALEFEASATLTLAVTPLPEHAGKEIDLGFAIECAADQNPDNNTASTTLKVATNLLPAITDLHVDLEDGLARLAWTAPLPGESGMEEVTEDFDEWADGPITSGSLSGWTFVCADNLDYKGLGSDDPGYKQKDVAAQIYAQGGVDKGRGMIVAGSYGENGALYGHPEKWIILPELAPGTTVRLNRAAEGCYGPSSAVNIEYRTSTSGTDPESFENLLEKDDVLKANAGWTEKEFTLPADARWFAIHITDMQAKYIAFDNLTFTRIAGAPVLQGYNIYHNSAAIGTAAADETSFIHEFGAEVRSTSAPHVYYVSAVYDQGESGAGIIVDASAAAGASDIVASAPFTLDGRTLTAGSAGQTVAVADLTGRVIATGAAPLTVGLPSAGIYILTIDGLTAKIAIR